MPIIFLSYHHGHRTHRRLPQPLFLPMTFSHHWSLPQLTTNDPFAQQQQQQQLLPIITITIIAITITIIEQMHHYIRQGRLFVIMLHIIMVGEKIARRRIHSYHLKVTHEMVRFVFLRQTPLQSIVQTPLEELVQYSLPFTFTMNASVTMTNVSMQLVNDCTMNVSPTRHGSRCISNRSSA